jgi:STAS domain
MAAVPTTIDLDVSAFVPDVLTIDALSRLQLSARRHGRRLRLRNASDELQNLIDLVGLGEVLGVCGVEPRRQPEQREQRGGVQEEREFDDPAV